MAKVVTAPSKRQMTKRPKGKAQKAVSKKRADPPDKTGGGMMSAAKAYGKEAMRKIKYYGTGAEHVIGNLTGYREARKISRMLKGQ